MKAKLHHSEMVMPGVMTFWFKPERPILFEAGQFIAMTIPHTNMDGRGDWREFSFSSSPDEELVAITFSYVEKGGSSYKKALLELKQGDEVFLNEPMGDFVLPKDPSIPLVFVAAGIGSTPYVSILKWLIKRNELRSIQLIYSASRPDKLLFENLWKQYKLDYRPIVSQADINWSGYTGRLTAKKIIDIANPINNKLIYLAGPQSMIEPLYGQLQELGIPRYQLLLDYFPGY